MFSIEMSLPLLKIPVLEQVCVAKVALLKGVAIGHMAMQMASLEHRKGLVTALERAFLNTIQSKIAHVVMVDLQPAYLARCKDCESNGGEARIPQVENLLNWRGVDRDRAIVLNGERVVVRVFPHGMRHLLVTRMH